ncbi:hypothetical protein [Acinetobacter bouvetii]|uniref:Uncharacterized protein n=1 Tax=Acinetobacter bouvetii TaxID=202951 RepID=A0A811GE91_9GAMM|nr:hypothetical protein [Acinetobacter bouvetii]CAB1220609.1 hypothetical protein SFB21_2636 [Acinetobacter bouvetii]
MHSKKIAFAVLMVTMVTTAAWAEPAIQAGDTLESLSQVKIDIRTHSSTPAQTENNQPATQQKPTTEPAAQMVDVDAIDQPIAQ